MSAGRLEGILAILVTPFHDDLSFDAASHRRQVDFAIDAGASGLVTTAVFGEFFTLSDSERNEILEATMDQVAGRVPVIATTSGVSTPHAVELTEDAFELGADAVMAMPPYFAQLPPDGVRGYFEEIADAAIGPVVLQNAGDFIGAPVPTAELRAMFESIERLDYLKEEVPPNPHSVDAAVEALGDTVKGVFGGHGGMYMISEHRRGATGWMPAPEYLEAVVRIHELLKAGDETAARELHLRLLPGLVAERLLGIRWSKAVLRERGVIDSEATRMPGAELDEEDRRELASVLNGLSDVLG